MPSNSAKRQKLDVLEHPVQSNIIHPGLNDETTTASWGFEICNLSEDELAEWSDLGYMPKTDVKCPMCGNSDHKAASCPNSRCLKVCSFCSTFLNRN